MLNSFHKLNRFLIYLSKALAYALFALFISHPNVGSALGLENSNDYFEHIKKQVFKDPYKVLPQYKVKRSLFKQGDTNLLLNDAKRTLTSQEDLIDFPAGQKLLQANGICFSGQWSINENSPYTGLYTANTKQAILARASVSLSGTKQRDKRAFAIAIKIFLEQDATKPLDTQNIFLMHSLGGIKTKYVLDLELDNQPQLGSLPPISQWLTAKRLESDLEKADKIYSHKKADARFRPISQLAEVSSDGTAISKVIAPHWLRLRVTKGTPKVDQNDFRDELALTHYPKGRLSWDILAANHTTKGKLDAQWELIGKLELSESTVSMSCDTKLHFSHPVIK